MLNKPLVQSSKATAIVLSIIVIIALFYGAIVMRQYFFANSQPGGGDSQPNPDTSTVIANPTTLPADGVAVTQITVTVRNAGGTGLPNVIVTLTSSRGATDFIGHYVGTVLTAGNTATSDANGIILFGSHSTTAGDATYTAITDSDITFTNRPVVTFTLVSSGGGGTSGGGGGTTGGGGGTTSGGGGGGTTSGGGGTTTSGGGGTTTGTTSTEVTSTDTSDTTDRSWLGLFTGIGTDPAESCGRFLAILPYFVIPSFFLLILILIMLYDTRRRVIDLQHGRKSEPPTPPAGTPPQA